MLTREGLGGAHGHQGKRELEVVFVDGKKGSLWRRESGVLIWARSIRDLKPEGL